MVVTGAAGFIGSHLVDRLLAEGHTVIAIDRLDRPEWRRFQAYNVAAMRKHSCCTFMEADLMDMDLQPVLTGADVVFHQAAIAGVRDSWGTMFQTYVDRNILALQRLLEACTAVDVGKFVYASSSSVYGKTSGRTTENATCLPISPYGMTKLAGEHLVRMYHVNFGLPTTALRYFTVYGPRQRPDMAFHKFLKAARDGSPITIYGDGRQRRDFTFVSDVVAANLQAMQCTEHGNVFNIGGGQQASVLDVLQTIREVTGRTLDVRHLPDQPGDPKSTWADTSSARRILGYAPQVSLRAGLDQEWHYIQEVYGAP